MADDYVTIDEIAEQAKVTPRTVRQWIKSDRIDAFHVGNRRRIVVRHEDAARLLAPRPLRAERPASQPARAS